jgi:hypothetical protein
VRTDAVRGDHGTDSYHFWAEQPAGIGTSYWSTPQRVGQNEL